MNQQPVSLLPEYWDETKVDRSEPYLRVSEFYGGTIQGEGATIGVPAVFLRLQGCPMHCVYCDTRAVYTRGKAYNTRYLSDILMREWSTGIHLVITGGSPLMQQEAVWAFLKQIPDHVYVEIENECYYAPNFYLRTRVNQWNNSPKLKASFPGGVYKPETQQGLQAFTSGMYSFEGKVYYKFVITNPETEWEEINQMIPKSQHLRIILMPQGQTRAELQTTQMQVVRLCVEKNVRYSPRLHIDLWDNKRGV